MSDNRALLTSPIEIGELQHYVHAFKASDFHDPALAAAVAKGLSPALASVLELAVALTSTFYVPLNLSHHHPEMYELFGRSLYNMGFAFARRRQALH